MLCSQKSTWKCGLMVHAMCIHKSFHLKIGLKLQNLQMVPDAHLLHKELPEQLTDTLYKAGMCVHHMNDC